MNSLEIRLEILNPSVEMDVQQNILNNIQYACIAQNDGLTNYKAEKVLTKNIIV